MLRAAFITVIALPCRFATEWAALWLCVAEGHVVEVIVTLTKAVELILGTELLTCLLAIHLLPQILSEHHELRIVHVGHALTLTLTLGGSRVRTLTLGIHSATFARVEEILGTFLLGLFDNLPGLKPMVVAGEPFSILRFHMVREWFSALVAI